MAFHAGKLNQEARAMRGLLGSFGGIRFAGAALLISPYGRLYTLQPLRIHHTAVF
jgi:hypothetical protein